MLRRGLKQCDIKGACRHRKAFLHPAIVALLTPAKLAGPRSKCDVDATRRRAIELEHEL